MDNDMKIVMCFILFGLIVVIVIPCVVTIASGKAIATVESFAVDSDGKLYVQCTPKDTQLLVYENGEHLATIDMKKSISVLENYTILRSFQFTIKNDRILVYAGGYLSTLDLEGNLITYTEDRSNSIANIGSVSKFKASNKDVYVKKYTMARTAIVKNDQTIVYQISVKSMLVKWGLILSAILLVYVVITVIKCYRADM